MSLHSYRKSGPLAASVLLAAGALLAAPAAHAQLSFTYTLFDPPGTVQDQNLTNYGSEASGVSAAGLVAGDYATGDDHLYGYIRNVDGTYKATGINFTGSAGGFDVVYTALSAINDAGYVTGNGLAGNNVPIQGFLYNYNTGSITTPVYNGAVYNIFNNVTESGLVAVISFATTDDYYAGNAMNSIYNIATGQFTAVNNLTGFAGTTAIQTATANGYLANGVDGDNGFGALVNTTTGTTTFINVPGAVSTRTDSINTAQTQVRGSYTDAAGIRHAFLYDIPSNKYYTTDPPSVTPTNPVTYSATYFSNNDTKFAGAYLLDDGTYHSFLITTSAAPEPSALALALPAASAVGIVLRRRRKASKNAR